LITLGVQGDDALAVWDISSAIGSLLAHTLIKN
jgi:hypothetical protein